MKSAQKYERPVAKPPAHCATTRSANMHALVEFFIGRLRDELLNETLFRSLSHARSGFANMSTRADNP
jgi:Integrase core domain